MSLVAHCESRDNLANGHGPIAKSNYLMLLARKDHVKLVVRTNFNATNSSIVANIEGCRGDRVGKLKRQQDKGFHLKETLHLLLELGTIEIEMEPILGSSICFI